MSRDGQQARSFEVQDNQRRWMKELHLITAKPVLYIANVSEDGFEDNPHLDAVADYVAKEGAEVVPVCAAIEADIAELDVEEAAEFLQEMGLDEPGLDRVIHAGYKLTQPANLFHRRAAGSACLDYSRRRHRAARCRCHSH